MADSRYSACGNPAVPVPPDDPTPDDDFNRIWVIEQEEAAEGIAGLADEDDDG